MLLAGGAAELFHQMASGFSADGQGWESVHITVKELLPIVVAIALWEDRWQGRTVCCRSDNAAVVSIINTRRSKDQLAMHLMRSLFSSLPGEVASCRLYMVRGG